MSQAFLIRGLGGWVSKVKPCSDCGNVAGDNLLEGCVVLVGFKIRGLGDVVKGTLQQCMLLSSLGIPDTPF